MNGICIATIGTCLLISLFGQTSSLGPLNDASERGKEILDALTSEEEERLIYHHDDSVIDTSLRDLPRGGMFAPELPLPSVPTMDPPLPDPTLQVSLRKTPKGFRSVMETAGRMLRLKRRPRTKLNPLPQYRSRPSSLISTQPDELEMAFKRIEIMASRVGLNMSSMPRRTQIKVIKKLTPKLPPRMSEVVKTALDSNDVKMFEYLPEPARDPLVEDNMEFINSFAHVDPDFGVSTTVKYEGVDISSISIADDAHSTHKHFEDLTTGLVPPKYDSSSGYSSDFESYTHVDGSGLSSSSSHSLNPSVDEAPISEVIYLPSPSPLVSHVDNFYEIAESMKYSSSELKPQIFTRGNKALKISSVKNATPFPRIVTPAKEKVSHKPIRVSIISKDSINIPEPPVTEKQPVKIRDQSAEVVKAKVVEVKKEIHREPLFVGKGKASKEVTEPPVTSTTSKEIVEEKPEETPEVLIIEEEPKPTLVLDTYKNPEESVSVPTADPFDLTSDEIAATVAELKKYEDYNSLEYSYLAPHPLEYPDHPDHPKSSSEELFNMEEYMAEAASEERPVTVAPSTTNPPLMVPLPMGGGSVILNPQFMGQQPQQQHHHHQQQNHQFGNKHPGMMRRPVKRPMRPMRRPIHKKPYMRPLRINNVEVKEMPKAINKECDYFSDDICLLVQDYPIEAISEAIDSSPLAKEMLVKEPEDFGNWVDGVPRHQEKNYNLKHYFGTDRIQNREISQQSHRHRDFAGEGGFLCPSKVAYGKIKKAKSSTTGKWKFVVNYGDKTQTLRLEKCLTPGNTCSYVMPHYRTACTQVHNYHRLLAWDSEKGLHMDVFKAPVTCTCHVQGYYIPGQSSHSGQGFTPAVTRRRDLPPKLNYSPPRTPMGRGSRKILPFKPFPNHMIIIPSAQPKPIAPPTPPPAAPKAVTPKEDDIHELLQQYSNLREKIAKRKNERQVSYSVTVTNSTESLRPKTRESRFTDKSSLKELKKLKLIIKNIKYNNTAVHKLKKIYNDLKKEIKLTTAPHLIKATSSPQQNSTSTSADKPMEKPGNKIRSKHTFKNGTKSSKDSFPPKMTRQRLIHHLKRNPKLIQMMKQQRKNKNARSGRSRNFLKSLSDILMGRGSGPRQGATKDKRGRALDIKARSESDILERQAVRQNTTQEILRRKALIAKAKQRLEAEKRQSKGSGNAAGSSASSTSPPKNGSSSSSASSGSKKGSGLTQEQRSRLRLSVNRPSKVNYSYHPIMDYYFGLGNNPDKIPSRTT